MTLVTRRRFLSIAASAAVAMPAGRAWADTAVWRGQALGAAASMQFADLPDHKAGNLYAHVQAELRRLEDIFSLYRDSALSKLNRIGSLTAPPPELLEVLSLCSRVHDASGGVFDPSVQPLWRAHAENRDAKAALSNVGWQNVAFSASEVRFKRPDMALTLNGIAQGYITDRISRLLHAKGMRNVLIDMGEITAIGRRMDGAAWRVGIAEPSGTVLRRIALNDRAIATSSPAGMTLPDGSSHILHPIGAASHHSLACISANSAALADGLSTAACLLTTELAKDMVKRFPDARIEVIS
ncbi:Thiamine biosynthesis lipoprotein ApbE precursor [Shimia sp. SK013]|uniref:FAD:protein FMN transferase n=1 Tax=Shimia sp. SK013 TaxID=1389006 RepID=UPI0006B58167|nr:FAD:protein FMN transferase [Shimia sp. SK013]KPA23650.1 Thiamine biosynthesis lipoprotein ApbE precursor [Shimia sp. SK013]